MTVFTAWPADVVWRRVCMRLFWVEAAQLVTRFAILSGVVWLGATMSGYRDLLLALPVLAGVAALRLLVLPRRIRSWGYAERSDDLLVRHGLLFRRLSIVPYGRMQFVDVTAGPLERLLGLATVQLHTAAAASDARIPGLLPAEATRLRDRLSALGEARAEGI